VIDEEIRTLLAQPSSPEIEARAELPADGLVGLYHRRPVSAPEAADIQLRHHIDPSPWQGGTPTQGPARQISSSHLLIIPRTPRSRHRLRIATSDTPES